MESKNLDPKTITRAGVCVALMAVASWVTIQIGPVPFTLQTLALTFTLLVLDGPEGMLAIGVYVLLGALGLPMFSGMRGGIGVLFGATGGYILGFILAAIVVAFLKQTTQASWQRDIVVAAVVLICAHVIGVFWLATVGAMGVGPAFLAGTVPFIIPDVAKAAVALVLARSLRTALA